MKLLREGANPNLEEHGEPLLLVALRLPEGKSSNIAAALLLHSAEPCSSVGLSPVALSLI